MDLGCSSFSWTTKDGRHLLGRTYDQFGDLAANRVIGVPPGIPSSPGLRPEGGGAPGRYGYTGMAVLGFGEPILVDEPIEGKPLPAHYILSDKTGEAVILEPDEGGLSVHRDTVGVLANSPDYLWHRTNLRNFVGVTNLPKAPRTVAGHEIREFGERLGGGSGLPGDYSSPSRFVRLAFLKEFAVRGRDEVDGVSRMFRAFAAVDIPEGLAKADPDYDVYEQTLCTSVMCAESGVYYFAPAWDRRISAVRLPAQGQEMRYFDLGDRQDIDYRN